jgi:hypothetical protein
VTRPGDEGRVLDGDAGTGDTEQQAEHEREKQQTEHRDSLSLLEQALRQALALVPREQVLQRLVAALPEASLSTELTAYTAPRASADTPPGAAIPAAAAAARSAPHSKVQKVSVSMPAELTEAVRSRTGVGGFSRYVTEAVQTRLTHDQLGDLLDELEAEHGKIPPEVREHTRQLWPDESQ